MEADYLEKEYQVLFNQTDAGWSEIEFNKPKIIDNNTFIIFLSLSNYLCIYIIFI